MRLMKFFVLAALLGIWNAAAQTVTARWIRR